MGRGSFQLAASQSWSFGERNPSVGGLCLAALPAREPPHGCEGTRPKTHAGSTPETGSEPLCGKRHIPTESTNGKPAGAASALTPSEGRPRTPALLLPSATYHRGYGPTTAADTSASLSWDTALTALANQERQQKSGGIKTPA